MEIAIKEKFAERNICLRSCGGWGGEGKTINKQINDTVYLKIKYYISNYKYSREAVINMLIRI